MTNKAPVIIGALILGGATILAITSQGKKPPPPKGAASFSVSVRNLPPDATGWGCAFQDPDTGIVYQPSNHPATGSFLFDASGSADMSAPVSSGLLSISAFAGVSLSTITQLVNYQINISIRNGGQYTFDFATQQFIE